MKEKNKIKRAFIWLWYNDIVRIFVIIIPTYFTIIIPLLILSGCPEKYFEIIIMTIYIFFVALAFVYNDYSNLRRIGLDEYRKPLTKKTGKRD